MEFIEEILNNDLNKACQKAGYNQSKLEVKICQIEGMGDYQCNDALSQCKIYHTSPLLIAQNIKDNFTSKIVEKIEIAKPGFINITIDKNFLAEYIQNYIKNIDSEITKRVEKKKTIVDYGGANVAKPLHVGHLRSLTIGESIKRICKYVGNETLGDIHLGDWGLQMGMIIAKLNELHKDWIYFDDNFDGEFPKESPLTIQDLESIYPLASKQSKEDEEFMEKARLATKHLQQGRRGYRALWRHFVDISIEDMKKNYNLLDVNFDLWLGESDSQPYCQKAIDLISQKGLAVRSQGALVMDISKEGDKKELPPIILIKTDGAVLYSTTEIATILMREEKFNAQRIIYLADNRQELHFNQVFRCIEKSQILHNPIKLNFVGFGTMNGKDGKPYKTRDGGVMKLRNLINDIREKASIKTSENDDNKFSKDEEENIANTVAVSALKFADLSIYRAKDYIFDIDKFSSFEGKTGPYILYTITRAKSILRKVGNFDKMLISKWCDKDILFALSQFANEVLKAYNELSPNILCDYVYKLANLFNSFYAKTNIIKENDKEKQNTLLTLTSCTLEIMEKVLTLLGIRTLERM